MFSEDFEIILHTGENPDRVQGADFTPTFLSELESELAELLESGERLQYEHTGVGRGADSSAILLVLAGLTLFFKGKSIEENLDAWISMSRRFLNALKRLRRFAGHVYVSEPAGSAIAVHFLTDLIPDVKRVSLLSSQIFIADTSGFREWARHQFRSIPERYYLYCFKTDNQDTHIVSG